MPLTETTFDPVPVPTASAELLDEVRGSTSLKVHKYADDLLVIMAPSVDVSQLVEELREFGS